MGMEIGPLNYTRSPLRVNELVLHTEVPGRVNMTSNSVTYGSERSSRHLSYNHLTDKFCAEDQSLMCADAAAQHPIPVHLLANKDTNARESSHMYVEKRVDRNL
jgi:hypothetical protein